MTAPTGKWVKQTGPYQNGENFVLGKVVVGAASYNGTRSRHDPKSYRASIELPGIKMKDGTTDFETLEEAKTRVEAAVATWFKSRCCLPRLAIALTIFWNSTARPLGVVVWPTGGKHEAYVSRCGHRRRTYRRIGLCTNVAGFNVRRNRGDQQPFRCARVRRLLLTAANNAYR
ncbi:hypothetical protein [Mesorhizobium retamae]|uniref:Uncharacterized protein n=1 Tax=Mesorhizobium retamae TaxID=2912854 RepID=A0ABS9QI87_9HYPH|nr:hypothetical protein [Mesorhizobium sp. IRAMC:0171]MCG7507102.1 hypothetical protein [Mesorhizobium sp. IRAMC:0171]